MKVDIDLFSFLISDGRWRRGFRFETSIFGISPKGKDNEAHDEGTEGAIQTNHHGLCNQVARERGGD